MHERPPRESNLNPETEGFRFETIPASELQQLREVDQKMRELIAEDNKMRAPHLPMADYSKVEELVRADKAELEGILKQSVVGDRVRHIRHSAERHFYGELEDITRSNIGEAMRYLDSLDLWKYKFTTEVRSGRHRSQYDWYNDSLYYVSRSGVSLRLKKDAGRNEGMAKVIQRFQEKTIFIGESLALKNTGENEEAVASNLFSEVPQMGWHIEEYLSDDFLRWQEEHGSPNEDFVSRVGVKQEGDQTLIQTRGTVHTHTGHKVNKIFFAKE